MDARTLKALKESIEHWKRLETGKRLDGENTYGGHCALCALFVPRVCAGCPVSEYTGVPGCVGSPYYNALYADSKSGLDSPAFKACAKLEREFLESLLPKENE